jgi:hypothetical protein
MKSTLIPFTIRLSLALAAGLAASTISSQAQSATATISGASVGGGLFDYTITLDNTGTVALESFWYAWTQDGNNLTTDPTVANNSLGWVNGLDSNSIQWKGSASDALQAGQKATFTFVDTENPTTITTSPQGESVAYVGSIDFSQGVSGDSTGIFSPVLVVPEPSSLTLLAAGLGIVGISLKSRNALRAAKTRV